MEEDWKPFEVRETWEGTTLCLHGPEGSRIKVEADKVANILEAIRRGWNVDIQYAIIDGGIDISEIGLGQNELEEPVIAGNIGIINSDINGMMLFSGASFDGVANFSEVRFKERAYFDGASFDGVANFSGTSFDGVSYFDGASFNREANFSEASFDGVANFSETRFKEIAYFDGARFKERAHFSEARFNGVADFDGARFNGVADFTRASFQDDPELIDTRHEELSPDSFASIGLAYRKSVLSGASYFFEKAGHGYWDGGDFSKASEAFRDAKVEYEKEGKYDEAGDMYIWEKDSTRRQLRFQKGERLKWIWFWIWKHVSNYGEAPLRFIGVAAIIIAVFAVLYMPIISSIPVVSDWFSLWPSITFKEYPFQPWSAGIVKGFLYNIMTAIYFSAVTFATLGFGDIAPVSIVGKFLTVVQVLLGYVMFGILITLVARKMTRS